MDQQKQNPMALLGMFVLFLCFCCCCSSLASMMSSTTATASTSATTTTPVAPAAPVAPVSPVAPAAPAGVSVNWIKKDNVAHYLGDSQYGAKTIGPVSGNLDKCKTDCNNNPECTHFNYNGANSCKLFRGGEWVGSQPGSSSYCKEQCQT
jgi:hypothetical protein